MKSHILLAASLTLTGCATFGGGAIVNDVPYCEKLIPHSLLEPVEGVDIPTPDKHPDGHEKAEPWMIAYLGNLGVIDKANDKAPAVDHIYRTCLELHRDALKRSQRGFFGRIFGG